MTKPKLPAETLAKLEELRAEAADIERPLVAIVQVAGKIIVSRSVKMIGCWVAKLSFSLVCVIRCVKC